MTAQEYIEEHALTEESIKAFGITYDENYLNIPIHDADGNFLFYKSRNLKFTKEGTEPKYKNALGSHSALFNYHRVRDEKKIVICEGEIDCIVLSQNKIPAVTTTSGAGKFEESFVKLLQGKEIFICLDNDEAGKKGVRNLLSFFPNALVVTLPEEYKDISDFFASKKESSDFVELMGKAQTASDWEASNIPEDFTVDSLADIVREEITQEAWLIKDILYGQGFCFFYGAEGTGKSLLALSVAKALADGQDWLGKFEVKEKHNVLILDKENPRSMIQKRAKAMGADNENIFYLRYPEKFTLSDGRGNASDFAKAISTTVAKKEIHCIVIDSFVDFMVGNESSAVDTQDFFEAIRLLYPRIAYLVLHHENKPSQGVFRNDSQRLRGSSNINAQLFTAFRLEPVAKSKTELTLKQVKARDSQKLDKFMIRMKVDYLDNGETAVSGFEYCGEVEEFIDETKVNEIENLIMDMLSASAYVSKKQIVELGEARGVSEKTIQRTIKKLLEEEELNEIKRGKEKWYTVRNMFTETSEEDENFTDIFDGELPQI